MPLGQPKGQRQQSYQFWQPADLTRQFFSGKASKRGKTLSLPKLKQAASIDSSTGAILSHRSVPKQASQELRTVLIARQNERNQMRGELNMLPKLPSVAVLQHVVDQQSSNNESDFAADLDSLRQGSHLQPKLTREHSYGSFQGDRNNQKRLMMLWGSTGGQQVKTNSPKRKNFGTLPDRLKIKESFTAKRSWTKNRQQ